MISKQNDFWKQVYSRPPSFILITGAVILFGVMLLWIGGPLRTLDAIAEMYSYYAMEDITAGQVVKAHATYDLGIEVADTLANTKVLGVAKTDIAVGEEGRIIQSNFAIVNAEAGVASAHFLYQSGTPGIVTKSTTPVTGVFAIAISDRGSHRYNANSDWIPNSVRAAINTAATAAGTGAGGGAPSTKTIPFELRFGIPETDLDVIDFRQGRDVLRLYACRTALSGSDTTSFLYFSIQLPADFGIFFAGTNVYLDTYTTEKDNGNVLTFTVLDSAGDADNGVNQADFMPSANATWEQQSDQITELNYAAGEWIGLRVTVNLDDGDSHWVGKGWLVYTTG
jgi:hypothetical protein